MSSSENTTLAAPVPAAGKKAPAQKKTKPETETEEKKKKAIVPVERPKAKRAIAKKDTEPKEPFKKTTLHKLVKVILHKIGGPATDMHVSESFVEGLEEIIRKGTVSVISMSNHISAYKGLMSTDGEAIVKTLKIIKQIKQNPAIINVL